MLARTRFAFLILGMAAAVPATAQDDSRITPSYSPTLTFGTGLVNIPVAWISRGNGDIWASMSMRNIGHGPSASAASDGSWDATQTLDAHIRGRFSLGVSLYGTKFQQFGVSGQWLALKQGEFGPAWLPSVAVGFRNWGSSKYQDRFVTGQRRSLDVYGDTVPGTLGQMNGAPTLYGVATREVAIGERSVFSVSLGYGNGLFKEDGGLDTAYNKAGTIVPGMFFGGRYAFPAFGGSLSIMGDNNGFDWGIGANYTYGFISIGLYNTEVESKRPKQESGSATYDGKLANYSKFAVSLSYNASLPGIFLGSRQRAEAADASLELRRLSQEIAQRRATTRALVAALNKAATAADAAAKGQQSALEKQLEAERIALKAAADRLEALQKKPPEQK
jgi:hypothetical protein